ncbi:MAG: low specificity L-threonine aldolase [Vicinamibacterales bacterium]
MAKQPKTVKPIGRRDVLRFGGVGVGAAAVGSWSLASAALHAQSAAPAGTMATSDPAHDRTVRFTGDGLSLTPAQSAHVLARLTEGGVVPDDYILGGVVEALETRMAALLGKDRAVLLPTGTLANHLAIRALAGGRGRAVVQAESHIYLDSGDCVQTLSGVTLMPLAPGRATFTADDLQQLLERNRTGRVATPIGVVSIESPVRRMRGQVFESGALDAAIALARKDGIRLHLDGARLFLEAAYANRPVADYARPFDTVYVSLYKYFNAPFGAMLAGPRDLLDGMYHTRRMFGGGLYQAWPAAALALHYLDGFTERYRRAIAVSEDLIARLAADGRFTIAREPHGTNLLRLTPKTTDPKAYRERLFARGVALGAPGATGAFLLATNETLNRASADRLARTFTDALAS